MRVAYGLGLLLAVGGLAGATTINFNSATDGTDLNTSNPYSSEGVSFSISGCSSCNWVVQNKTQGGVLAPGGGQYVNLGGTTSSSVDFQISFATGQSSVSFKTLGLEAGAGGWLDGATVTFFTGGGFTAGDEISGSLLPGEPPALSSAVGGSIVTYSFNSSVPITGIEFTKTQGSNPNGGYFGFNDLTFSTDPPGVPEPASMLLGGAGLLLVGFIRRRAKA